MSEIHDAYPAEKGTTYVRFKHTIDTKAEDTKRDASA